MEVVTVFTPTFNRKEELKRLYTSLLNQTSKKFVWLIVDDGSTDGTEDYINKIIDKNLIKIEYKKQENAGKYVAHNTGVDLTKTELFCCVDSDDILVPTAIERIILNWNIVAQKESIIGLVAIKANFNGEKITLMSENLYESTLSEAYRKREIQGDAMLIYCSKLIKKCSFPYIKTEKFFPEVYLYDLLDDLGNLIFINETICLCEYLEGGYTNNLSKVLIENPTGYLYFLKRRIEFSKNGDLISRLSNTIKYTGLCIAIGKRYDLNNRLEHIFLYPASYLYFLKRFKKI